MQVGREKYPLAFFSPIDASIGETSWSVNKFDNSGGEVGNVSYSYGKRKKAGPFCAHQPSAKRDLLLRLNFPER